MWPGDDDLMAVIAEQNVTEALEVADRSVATPRRRC